MAMIVTCPVVSKQQLNERYCLIGFFAPDLMAEVQAGQFINVQVSAFGHDPLLRRPFSVHRVEREAGVVYILFKIIGRGTEILRDVEPGAQLQIMGPLGNGFTLRSGEDVLLVGGGIGVAPLYELALRLTAMENRVTVLLGLTDREDLVLAEVLEQFAPKVIVLQRDALAFEQTADRLLRCTQAETKQVTQKQQGIMQHQVTGIPQGLVTDLLAQELQDWHYTQVYACGPKPMLAAVQKMLGERRELAQLSMEEKMGCGIGLCFSCTCKVKDETRAEQWSNERVCTRGPVFSGTEVIFDA